MPYILEREPEEEATRAPQQTITTPHPYEKSLETFGTDHV